MRCDRRKKSSTGKKNLDLPLASGFAMYNIPLKGRVGFCGAEPHHGEGWKSRRAYHYVNHGPIAPLPATRYRRSGHDENRAGFAGAALVRHAVERVSRSGEQGPQRKLPIRRIETVRQRDMAAGVQLEYRAVARGAPALRQARQIAGLVREQPAAGCRSVMRGTGKVMQHAFRAGGVDGED